MSRLQVILFLSHFQLSQIPSRRHRACSQEDHMHPFSEGYDLHRTQLLLSMEAETERGPKGLQRPARRGLWWSASASSLKLVRGETG